MYGLSSRKKNISAGKLSLLLKLLRGIMIIPTNYIQTKTDKALAIQQ